MKSKYENLWNKEYNVPEPGCLHKWQWSTVFLQTQTTSSCHRPIPEKITPENFEDFHNTPEKLIARQKMLDGQWPGKGCEYCRDIEAVGGRSDRTGINNQFKRINYMSPKEFELGQEVVPIKVSPRTLEVNFSNLCNQGCMYCFSRCSSKIEAEERKYYFDDNKPDATNEERINYKNEKKEFDIKRASDYKAMKIKFWEWMEKNAAQLFNYRILGGEPFYQPEIYENIEFFKKNKCPYLMVTIFTNLNVDTVKFAKAIEGFKELIEMGHLRKIIINISTDAWGPAEEYVRYGSNNKRWMTNFELLNQYHDKFDVAILSTLCNLNIKSALGIVKIFNESKFAGRKDQSVMHFNIAHGHPHLVFDIFPKGFFDKDFDEIKEEIQEPWVKDQVEGYKKVANAGEYRPDLIYKLKEHLDKMDARRNLNWKETFPWLDQFNPEDYTE